MLRRIMSRPSPTSATTLALAIAAIVAVAAAALAWRAFSAPSPEGFSIDGLVNKIKDGGEKVVQGGKDVVGTARDKVTGVTGGGGGGGGPTYVGRAWTGVDWACPAGTIETGQEDAKACITSQFHPQLWRWDGKQWGWSCPNGTTPSTRDKWEEKCEVGHVARVSSDDGWKCPSGTTDTGKTWENSTWHEAHKQCKRDGPYTLRVKVGGKWQCPPFSQDTGRSWESKTNQWDQCKWTQ